MNMRGLRILWRILRQTRATNVAVYLICIYLGCSVVIWLVDPAIPTFGKGLWYCYMVMTTIGFGDVVAESMAARVISVILSIHSAIAVAIITGVVVNFYTNMVEAKQEETLTAFLDKLECLPDLSKEELTELSDKVREKRAGHLFKWEKLNK